MLVRFLSIRIVLVIAMRIRSRTNIIFRIITIQIPLRILVILTYSPALPCDTPTVACTTSSNHPFTHSDRHASCTCKSSTCNSYYCTSYSTDPFDAGGQGDVYDWWVTSLSRWFCGVEAVYVEGELGCSSYYYVDGEIVRLRRLLFMLPMCPMAMWTRLRLVKLLVVLGPLGSKWVRRILLFA